MNIQIHRPREAREKHHGIELYIVRGHMMCHMSMPWLQQASKQDQQMMNGLMRIQVSYYEHL